VKQYILFLITVSLLSLPCSAASVRHVQKLPGQVIDKLHRTSELDSICVLQIHNDTADSYFDGFATGDGIAIYIDPSICAPVTYPYEVQGIYLTLYGDSLAVWPVHLAVEIWSASSSCSGPKTLIYSESYSLDSADFQFSHVGVIPFSDTVCVTAPFYTVIKYIGGTSSPYPSIIFDSDLPGDTCGNWGYATGYGWYKWNGYWTAPIPGNCILWVGGQPKSSLCSSSCCAGTTGNVTATGIVDLADLSALVNYLIGGGYVLPCPAEANINGSGIIDLVDLSSLVNYLISGEFTLPNCP
jgi:hypothetical protein